MKPLRHRVEKPAPTEGGADILAVANGSVALRLIWLGLRSGRLHVEDAFDTDTHHVLLLKVRDASASPPPSFDVLEALLASGQKGAALDLNLAPSTVALRSRACLESIGVCDRPSRISSLLAFACFAQWQLSPVRAAAVEMAGVLQISFPRCDERLAQALAPAEFAVVRQLLAGFSYTEIAARRGTSVRTVANQITAVFRRLRVSGRTELLKWLAFETFRTAEQARPAPMMASRRDVRFGDVRTKLAEFKRALGEARAAAQGTRHEEPFELVDLQVAVLERQISSLESRINEDEAKVRFMGEAS